MEMMLSLLGTEEPNFLFANTAITEPRALAEEADWFFLATQRFAPEVLAPTRSGTFPGTGMPPGRTGADVSDSSPGLCYYHARYGAKAKMCRPPCTYKGPGNAKACTR